MWSMSHGAMLAVAKLLVGPPMPDWSVIKVRRLRINPIGPPGLLGVGCMADNLLRKQYF